MVRFFLTAFLFTNRLHILALGTRLSEVGGQHSENSTRTQKFYHFPHTAECQAPLLFPDCLSPVRCFLAIDPRLPFQNLARKVHVGATTWAFQIVKQDWLTMRRRF